MDPTITSREIFERIKQEHDSLREKVRRIHDVLAGPEIAAEEMTRLLREFHNALTVHFSNEESDGFFEEHHCGFRCLCHAEAKRPTDQADRAGLPASVDSGGPKQFHT